jgi:hypothetical protein
MKAKPYVGITGPTSLVETICLCDAFKEAGFSISTSQIPMIGLLASYKTLNGIGVNNRRYPRFEHLLPLLSRANRDVFPMIHYNTRDNDTLSQQISRLFDGVYDEGLCRALQLNLAWPDISEVEKIMNIFPQMQIVFQASSAIMEEVSDTTQLAKRIAEYRDFISYILIDPSGGRGKVFNVESSVNVYQELVERCPDLTIGFAGGFTGENAASRIEKIRKEVGKDFCIDAEGGLRDKLSEEYGDDTLNMKKVESYLNGASTILR